MNITLHNQTYYNENHTHTHTHTHTQIQKHVSSLDLNPKAANLGSSSEKVKGKMGRGVRVLG